MKPEDAIVHVAGAATTKSADEPARKTRKKQRALELSDRLDILEAERLVLTIEVRCALLREAKRLLPTAIKQARGDGKRPGSPALLRLIARLAMRDVRLDRPPRSAARFPTAVGRNRASPSRVDTAPRVPNSERSWTTPRPYW